MARNKTETTCLVCFFKPTLIFGSVNVTPLEYTCPHSKKPSEILFRKSQFLGFLSFLLSLSVTATLLDSIRDFREADLSVIDTFIAVDDILINACASSLFFISFLMISQKALELQSLAEIIHDGEQRGIVFLDAKFVRINTYVTYVGIAALVALQAATIVIFIFEGVFTRTRIRVLCSDTIELLEGCLAVHYHNLMITFPHVFKRLFLQVKYVLKKRLDGNCEVVKTFECINFTSEEEEACHIFSRSLPEQ